MCVQQDEEINAFHTVKSSVRTVPAIIKPMAQKSKLFKSVHSPMRRILQTLMKVEGLSYPVDLSRYKPSSSRLFSPVS